MNKKVVKPLFLLSFAFCLAFLPPLATFADDGEGYNAINVWSESKLKRYAEDNILYYDDQFEEERGEGDECISNGGVAIDIDASDNIGYIMSKLKEAGYSVTSIAAIMGNLKAENSTHNPRLLEKALPNGSHIVPDGFIAYDLSKSGSDGKIYNGGLGIAQWTYWSRVKSLQEHANNLGEPVYSLVAQTSFLVQEIQGYDGLSPSALNTLNMRDATNRVLFNYENPEVKSESVQNTRYNYATEYYTRLLGENPDEPTPENPDLVICPEGGGGTGGGNWSDEDIQKYIYLQGDSRWGNLNYGPDGINGNNGTSIRESGCGPSSFATIVSILKNQYIYPSETADIAGRGGQHCYKDGSWCGSNHSITTYLGNYYGVNTQPISISIQSIQAALDSGQMVHIVGTGSLPFSQGGHYVAIIKSANDKWWVANSGYTAHKWEAYDPITIVSNARYAVAVWN
ncbi:MAG: phage tail tip lysozyme [Candidatus Saccharibacteria bacterium]|nr:phage tail tip lysozyme [Candidatus Saccharibacteria bacterium]